MEPPSLPAKHVLEYLAAVDALVVHLRITKTVTDSYARWQVEPLAGSAFAFEIFVYLDDGEPQIAVTRQTGDAAGTVWSRPFEIPDFGGPEAQLTTCLETARTLLTRRTRLEWKKRVLATSVTCSYMDNAGKWNPVWTTVWAGTAGAPPLGSSPKEGAWEAGPVATLEQGVLRPVASGS